MKIGLILSGGYTSSLYTVTKDIVDQLKSEGHQVDTIFLSAPESNARDSDKFLNVEGISPRNTKTVMGFILRVLKNLLGKELYQILFSRYFCRQIEPFVADYDSLFIHGTNYRPLHSIRRKHYVVLHCCKYGSFLGKRKGFGKYFFKKLYQKVYGNKNLLTVSNSVGQTLVENMGVRPSSLETIYNGFNFPKLQERAFIGSAEGAPDKYIMAAGRPDRSKRFDILLQAYARTKRTHKLVIFGDGRGLKKLKVLSCKLGIEDDVIFWGYCNQLLPYFKKASAFILSSDIEGLPTVVVESLTLGTPVVATDAAGVNEMLSGELQKWVVPRGDIEALARNIDLVLELPPIVGPENIDFLDYRKISKRYVELTKNMSER